MKRAFLALCLLLSACGGDDEQQRAQEIEPPDAEASGGKIADDDWQTRAVCLTDEMAQPLLAPAPPVHKDLFRREGAFGNKRWSGGYYLDVVTDATQELSGRRISSRVEAGVNATLFEQPNLDLARIVLTSTALDAEPAHLSADLVFGGRFVFPIFDFTGGFTVSKAKTFPLVEIYYVYPFAGELSLTLEFEVWGTLGFELSGQAHGFGLSAKAAARAGLAVAGGVSIGDTTQIVKASLRGGLELIDAEAPVGVGFLIDPTQADPEVSWYLTCGAELHWLRGDITIEASLLSKDVKKVLAEWPGYESKRELALGRGALTIDPPTHQCQMVPAAASPSVGLPSVPSPASMSAAGFELPSFERVMATLGSQPSLAEQAEALSALKRILRDQRVSRDEVVASLDSERSADVVAALGADGSERSLEILLAAAKNLELSEDLRVSALASLGLSLRVSVDAVQTLRGLRLETPTLRETALYALGNAADTLAAAQPEIAESVVAELAERASASSAPSQHVVATRALGNVGTVGAREALQRLAHSNEPELRSAAVDALARARALPTRVLRSSLADYDKSSTRRTTAAK